MTYYSSWNSEDPYIRALVRGRAITSALARLIDMNDRGGFWMDMRRVLAGDGAHLDPKRPDAQEILNHVWAMHTPVFGPDKP